MSMSHGAPGTSFSELIAASRPEYFPVQENRGVGGTTIDWALTNITADVLARFPGHYVVLSFGTNNTPGTTVAPYTDPLVFYQEYAGLVDLVIAAGKVPVIPHIPWGHDDNVQRWGPGVNAQIDRLYAAYPQLVVARTSGRFTRPTRTLSERSTRRATASLRIGSSGRRRCSPTSMRSSPRPHARRALR